MGVGDSRNPPQTIDQLSQQQQQDPNAPSWWYKILLKAAGVIGGIVAMITGLVSCITLTAKCLIAGVFLICFGAFVVMFEAPCCCPWIEFINQITAFSERRPAWQKAIFYGAPSFIPLILCFGLTTFFGVALIFVTAALYGLQALGRKADRQTMIANASKRDDVEMKETLIENEVHPDLHVPSK
ncbi:calcium channel flower homolog [Patella vulgata]|uniref:calcium channel flower homolog n=1 Tax=Patella vulgata TaxID=6465 RepID=UPI00217F4936|nr:calcium channel flower homolog [Patella vulgata]